MGKALVLISLTSLVAIVIMAAMVFTSFDRREEAQLQRDVLATKTAESRSSPTTSNRDDAVDVTGDTAFPEESNHSDDSQDVRRGEDSSPR